MAESGRKGSISRLCLLAASKEWSEYVHAATDLELVQDLGHVVPPPLGCGVPEVLTAGVGGAGGGANVVTWKRRSSSMMKKCKVYLTTYLQTV